MVSSVSDQAVELEVGRDPEGVRLTLSVGSLSVACVLPPPAVDELIEKMAGAGESARIEAQQARERRMAERKERRGTGAEEVLGLIQGGCCGSARSWSCGRAATSIAPRCWPTGGSLSAATC